MNAPRSMRLAFSLLIAGVLIGTSAQGTANPLPYAGTEVIKSSRGFDATVRRLEQAISDNGMGLVAAASASRGAAARGIKIAGNIVLMVFRNDYAVRMLAASVPAGFEAPLRIYVTENSDGTTSVTYRMPSAVFAPYGSAELDAMAKELDIVFKKIVSDAVDQ